MCMYWGTDHVVIMVRSTARCTRVHVLGNRSRGYYGEVNGEVYTCACTGEQIKWLLWRGKWRGVHVCMYCGTDHVVTMER